MTRILGFVFVALIAGTAESAAQPAYVGASVFGDFVRLTQTRYRALEDDAGGEAVGFALRVGTHITDRWGVELEFARPSEIDGDGGFEILPAQVTFASLSDLVPPGVTLPSPLIFPPFSYRTTMRNTTISPAAFVRQDLTDRSSLVYLGGLGFYRTEREFGLASDPRALGGTGLSIVPFRSETVHYGVKPFVGVEGRIGLGEHGQLVPALRLHGIDGGWLVRPGVGVNWVF